MKKNNFIKTSISLAMATILLLSGLPVYSADSDFVDDSEYADDTEHEEEIDFEQQQEELDSSASENEASENVANNAIYNSKNYEYLEADIKADSAYVIFGDSVKEHNATFIDGLKNGVTDSNNEFYNEKSSELNVQGRKFYAANYVNVKIDKEFYSEGDSEFLVSVVYYDYGPSEGKFRFEYIAKDGTPKTVTFVKPGKVQDWFVKTAYINDADFAAAFESGANVRLGNNAYNLFKRIEIVNISKLKRENKATSAVCFTLDEKTALGQMKIIDEASNIYADANLHKKCSLTDVENIFSIISGVKKSSGNNNDITNAELIKKSFDLAKIPYTDDALLDIAYNTGIVKAKDLVFDINSHATYYNLYSVVYNLLFYENADKETLISQMIKRNYFSDEMANTISDEKFLSAWYKVPKKCPSKLIRDNTTGTTYRYMNIYGNPTWRPYVTMQCWTDDGTSFICGLATGDMYLYNTETEMLQYLDKTLSSGERLHAIVGTDDCVYYFKQETVSSIWKIDIHTMEKVKIADAPASVSLSEISISNDCNFIGARCTDSSNSFSKPGEFPSVVYDIKNDKWNFFAHSFDYSNNLTHSQVNPQYPNLVSFAHEIGNGFTANHITDRIWLYDFNTNEAKVMFKQGIRPTNGKAVQGATHELWSNNGEYMYFVSYSVSDAEADMSNMGRVPSVIRYNIDGSHRKYYWNPNDPMRYYSHCYPTGDDKFIVVDTSVNANILTLINTQTNEVFDLADIVWQGKTRHPYQMHPVVARDKYVASWGALDSGVLGVMWIDFTDIANKSAKGGVIDLNDTVSSVSYENLDCEISPAVKEGKDCYYVKPNNKMYIDINENVIDCIDGKIKLTFEYYDNSIQPLIITYTSGVKTDNDHINVENAEKRISRKASRKWKKAEVIIESGNFEDIGIYDSDLNIKGLCSAAYIRNVTAQKID